MDEALEPEEVTLEEDTDPMIEVLVKERHARNMTQAEVAKHMGVNPAYVSQLESGELDPRLSTLRRWHAAVFMELVSRSTKPGPGRRTNNHR